MTHAGMTSTITVTVPLKFARRGGRKVIVSPLSDRPPPPKFDNALIKALARAHRWRRLIESGEYSSITELAKSEKVNESYACRLLRLTLLAPEIVEAVLNGTQPRDLRINHLLGRVPACWVDQERKLFGGYKKVGAARLVRKSQGSENIKS
jgi:hypothetical protein